MPLIFAERRSSYAGASLVVAGDGCVEEPMMEAEMSLGYMWR